MSTGDPPSVPRFCSPPPPLGVDVDRAVHPARLRVPGVEPQRMQQRSAPRARAPFLRWIVGGALIIVSTGLVTTFLVRTPNDTCLRTCFDAYARCSGAKPAACGVAREQCEAQCADPTMAAVTSPSP